MCLYRIDFFFVKINEKYVMNVSDRGFDPVEVRLIILLSKLLDRLDTTTKFNFDTDSQR